MEVPMRSSFYDLNPTTEQLEIALAGIRKAEKQMRSQPRRRERLARVAIGVSSDGVIWGELGVCNARDTSRSYAVLDVAEFTCGALRDISVRDLHLVMFGLPNALEITVQLMSAMLWQRDCEESGYNGWNSAAVDTHLQELVEQISIGVSVIGDH
jgi:hypothetical protein